MKTPPKNEVLEIRNLGPIKELRIEPKPLTLFIGEQASGKSLAAQVLYFFRELRSLLGRNFTPSTTDKKGWREAEIRTLLDQFRGAPFHCFANGGSSMQYVRDGRDPWIITLSSDDEEIVLSPALRADMDKWAEQWSADSASLGETRESRHIFIPTERSVFTRLAEDEPSVLYAPYQTMFLRQFATVLERAKKTYSSSHGGLAYVFTPVFGKHVNYILNRQRVALGGEVHLSGEEPRRWQWKIEDAAKYIPIKATSSGQMEAWPFFVIAVSHGALNVESHQVYFYFEEPEAHLHPQAQVEVVKVIAYLVNLGHHFVVTTHSPYIVYKFNNMIQRYLSTGKDFDEESQEPGLDPDKVCAYRFRAAQSGPPEDILDRQDTQLIEVHELNRVADELSREFNAVFFAGDGK